MQFNPINIAPQNAKLSLTIVAAIAMLVPASFTQAAQAQVPQDEESIDEIVVVANKSARSVREIAANVTVMSRSEISDNLATTVADVFRYSPGIDYEAAGS